MRYRISPQELLLFRDYVYEICGVDLQSNKSYLFEFRLSPLIDEFGLSSFSELYHEVRRNAAGRERLISAITTDESSFFRDSHIFETIGGTLIPELFDLARKKGRSLRIWSAACSRGQEPYSLAMAILERFPGGGGHINILATDISNEALSYAKAGVYTKFELSRGVNLTRLERWFVKEGESWRVADKLKRLVSFQKVNLLKNMPVHGPFDLILCRNVAVYFKEDDRRHLYDTFSRHLGAEGALILGSSEQLFNPLYKQKQSGSLIYYQHQS